VFEEDRHVQGRLVDLTLEDLSPGDVVIKATYSSVNYKDALAATGKGKILRRASCIGGIDFSGTVVSSTNPQFNKGDAVVGVGYDLGVSHHGGYSQYARVPGSWLIKLPQGMSLWDAMAFGTAGFTAGIGIVRMEENRLKPANGPVIVNGATGGVGSIALAALARLGYQVVALTGKESESDWLKKLGAKEVLLRQSLNLEKIKPLDKATWAGAVDNLGGPVLAWMASTMKDNGTIASIGLAASPELHTWVMPFILRGACLLGINSGESVPPEVREKVWRRLGTDMKPPLLKEMARTVPFSELPSVFDDFINAKVNRRVVVDLNE
jgi:acrylyl-CoA reductase (NADPH)